MPLKWIKPIRDFGDVSPVYVTSFSGRGVQTAILHLSSMGVYEAELNGVRISDYVLAPGWTTKRLQYQTYDISHLLKEENTLSISVGRGWYRSPIATWREGEVQAQTILPPGLAVELSLDGRILEDWQVKEGAVRFSELYDGELYDANFTDCQLEPVELYPGPGLPLVPQQGELIKEQERLQPAAIITTPKGETVIDFGQNLTGYIELLLPESTKANSKVTISFAETLDKHGNFYKENYRAAKSMLNYVCRDGAQTYKPKHTFFGFRYIRLDEFPIEACASYFTAIAVYSDIKRTGYFECSHPLINRLYENVIWGQKGNFLDVPTDCPQRDERLGWTGDAQAFVKAAAYNFDVEQFFTKWLADLALDQTAEGKVHHVIPDVLDDAGGSAAWGDAATICPWEIYLAYGDSAILERQFESMCKWISFITTTTKDEHLWTGGTHFGDWLALDAYDFENGGTEGRTRKDFLASAFYAHSTKLVIKAGKVLGKDVSKYEELYKSIVQKFEATFNTYNTQTEHVLALHFGLTGGKDAEVAKSLADLVVADGTCLQTGFVGTPYLMHVLSNHGYTELAYSLLLRTEYPSWLYPVTKGATTIWERWDSIKPNGDFQTVGMNSFNHYAYGAVADWLYGVVTGIKPIEPGYKKVRIAPLPDTRLEWAAAKIETRQGLVCSKWQVLEGRIRYDIEVPTQAEVVIDGQVYYVGKGSHVFYSG